MCRDEKVLFQSNNKEEVKGGKSTAENNGK